MGISLCVLLQMEQIIERMQDENTGVPVRTVKSFMTKIPSVFIGKLFVVHSVMLVQSDTFMRTKSFCLKRFPQ